MSKASHAYSFALIRQRMREHPGPLLDFALGETTHALPPAVDELVAREGRMAMRRADPRDHRAFAEAATTMLSREYDVEVSVEAILPAPGGRPVISAVAACLLRPGDGVVVTEPGYPAFARVAAQHYAHVHTALLDPERGFAPALEPLRHAGETVRVVAMNYPNNPTGAVLSRDTLGAFVEGAFPRATLFNDATYGPFTHDAAPRSMLDTAHTNAHGQPTLELHALSKMFALGPLSVSFLVGTEELVTRVREYSDFVWPPLSALQLRAATLCLLEAGHFQRVRRAVRARVDHLRETLSELGFAAFPTPGGMYVLTAVPQSIGDATIGSAGQAADVLLNQFGLAVVPWDTPLSGYLRFSSLYADKDLDALKGLGLRLGSAPLG